MIETNYSPQRVAKQRRRHRQKKRTRQLAHVDELIAGLNAERARLTGALRRDELRTRQGRLVYVGCEAVELLSVGSLYCRVLDNLDAVRAVPFDQISLVPDTDRVVQRRLPFGDSVR